MTNKTERQISAMKTQTIGVEIEMNNITRKAAAKLAAEFLGTGHWDNTADRNVQDVGLNGLTDLERMGRHRPRVEILPGRQHRRP